MYRPRSKGPPLGSQQPKQHGNPGIFYPPPPAGNIALYNPNSFNPVQPPNGPWIPNKVQPANEKDLRNLGGDDLNNRPTYPDQKDGFSNPTQHPQNILPVSQANQVNYENPSQQIYPSERQNVVNNNQYGNTGNADSWGWNEADDWGWNEEPSTSEPLQHNLQHSVIKQEMYPDIKPEISRDYGYQGNVLSQATGLEQEMVTLALTDQVKEEIQTFDTQQQQSTASYSDPQSWSGVPVNESTVSHDDPLTWSRVSTWGSNFPQGSEEEIPNELEGSEKHTGLGRRSTSVDGASFTDPVQPTYLSGVDSLGRRLESDNTVPQMHIPTQQDSAQWSSQEPLSAENPIARLPTVEHSGFTVTAQQQSSNKPSFYIGSRPLPQPQISNQSSGNHQEAIASTPVPKSYPAVGVTDIHSGRPNSLIPTSLEGFVGAHSFLNNEESGDYAKEERPVDTISSQGVTMVPNYQNMPLSLPVYSAASSSNSLTVSHPGREASGINNNSANLVGPSGGNSATGSMNSFTSSSIPESGISTRTAANQAISSHTLVLPLQQPVGGNPITNPVPSHSGINNQLPPNINTVIGTPMVNPVNAELGNLGPSGSLVSSNIVAESETHTTLVHPSTLQTYDAAPGGFNEIPVSRSQSGTPLMERENERPDAEGGYENDQPTPLANPVIYSQASTTYGLERKVHNESPSGSRPASRQAGSTTSDSGHIGSSGYYLDSHVQSSVNPYVRPKPAPGSHYPANVPPSSQPTLLQPTPARLPQEAVGSEFGPPINAVLSGRNTLMSQQQQQHENPQSTLLPPSSQRMIPGSGAHGPPPLMGQSQAPIPQISRPTGSITPVTEQRIVTGYARNDHPSSSAPTLSQPQQDDHRTTRSPPPPHRSETIGSENPRANLPSGTPITGNGGPDRSDDRPSSDRDRERDGEMLLNRSRVERDRERDHDYERERRGRYPDEDEEDRFSSGYRDRRYDDRERDRDRDVRGGYPHDYDDDRSGYSDRDRGRDSRRRESRRSDYYPDADLYDRSGRRSSLYDNENDTTADYNRSIYGYHYSRDGRRRDYDRHRPDDRYYSSQRDRASHGSTSVDVNERSVSERDFRSGRDPRYDGYRRDPRDVYYRDPYYYSRNAYDPYRQYPAAYDYYNYAYKYNYALYEEMKKNPAAWNEWYQRHYGQRYTPTVTTGPGTTTGSIAASEADRGSVHSGRSSVNDELQKTTQQLSMTVTGMEQTNVYDYGVFQENEPSLLIESKEPQDHTPHKFSFPHVIGRLSANGVLVKVLPNSPKDGVPAYLELHDLDVLLGDLPTAQELKYYPGPLVPGQTHKQQITVFCQQKIRKAMEDPQMVDRQSFILLWELLLLLLRQNGTIVGTDIAELLLKDHEILREPIIQEVNENSDVVADRTIVSRQTEASVTKKFRQLLLFGNKKEALEWAMAQGLWGHALFLASKMDQRTYNSVMIRFANGLALTDPIQTLYQLMSGRQPTAVTSCGDEKWGDWRPHLAMILSNTTSKPELDTKSIVALGDTLAIKGYLLAAQFCYLVAQVEFGSYSNKSSKLVLLTSSASLPFDQFATNEAIQCTEVYEYTRQLAFPDYVIPSFQSYKFLYATRLVEHGRAPEALQYCEAIGRVLTRNPTAYSPAFLSQVLELGSMLKFNSSQYQMENDGDGIEDPQWLKDLQAASETSHVPASESEPPSYINTPQTVDDSWTQGQSLEQQTQYYMQSVDQPYMQQPVQQEYIQTPSQQSYAEEQLNGTQMRENVQDPNNASSLNANYNSYPPQYNWQQPWNYEDTSRHSGYPPQESGASLNYLGQSGNNLSPVLTDEEFHSGPSSLPADLQHGKSSVKNGDKSSKDSKGKSAPPQAGTGWFGGLFSRISLKPKNQMKLPDDKNPAIVWDPDTKQWVNTQGGDDNGLAGPAAPPKDSELQPKINTPPLSSTPLTNNSPTTIAPPPPPPTGGNKYKLPKGRGSRHNYVDVLNPGKASTPSPILDPYSNNSQLGNTNPQFFVPAPAPLDPSAPTDFVSAPVQVTPPETNELVMYNPSQFTTGPASGAGRGLSGRRYPR